MVRLTSTGASPTEGSSIRRMRGASISARASASICCSPPLMLPASWPAARPAAGSIRSRRSRFVLIVRARLAAERAEQQVFLHGQPRKQPAAFRYQRNAEVDDLFGGAADEVVALAVDLGGDAAGARAHDAHDAFHQRALAVAVGAEQHHRFAAADGERHVLEHAHGAVGGVDPLDGEAIGQGRPSPLRDRG